MRGIILCWLRCYAVAGESQLLTTPARPPPAAALESVRRAAPHSHTARRGARRTRLASGASGLERARWGRA